MSTAMQIIDGFFVKRTKDIRDSVAYLTIMTRTLQQHYSVSHGGDKEGRGLIKYVGGSLCCLYRARPSRHIPGTQ